MCFSNNKKGRDFPARHITQITEYEVVNKRHKVAV